MNERNPQRKACPIVLQQDREGTQRILAFEHPLAGFQLIKGSIEAGESPEGAATRELAEESGIADAHLVCDLGIFDVGPPNQTWYPFVYQTHVLPESWAFRTTDDGGHDFRFFWHPLAVSADERWHIIFQQALFEIRARLIAKALL